MRKTIGKRVLLTVDFDLLEEAGKMARSVCLPRARVLVGWMRQGRDVWASKVEECGVEIEEVTEGEEVEAVSDYSFVHAKCAESVVNRLDGAKERASERLSGTGSEAGSDSRGKPTNGKNTTSGRKEATGCRVSAGRRGIARTGGPGQTM